MAVGSGIGSQFGVAAEGTYGTFQTPVRFYEVKKGGVSKVKNTATWDGLAAGRLVNRADGRAVTTRAAAANVDELVCTTRDLGLLLNFIFGGTVTPTNLGGAPAAYQQLHPLVDSFGKSFTAQSGVPLIGGSVIPQSGLGCKVTSAEFSCGVNDLLTVKVDADGRDLTEAQTLAAASFTVGRKPFHFGQMGVKVGATVGGVAAADGVRKVTLKVDRKLKTDQFYANAGGLKDQPTTNEKVGVTGVISADYKTAAHFADRFRDDTQFSLVWEFVGATISGANTELLRFTAPACFLEGDTPAVDGPDVVSTDFPFTVYDDLTTGYPVRVEYVTQDTTL